MNDLASVTTCDRSSHDHSSLADARACAAADNPGAADIWSDAVNALDDSMHCTNPDHAFGCACHAGGEAVTR